MSKKDLLPKWGINLYFSFLKTLHSIPYHDLWNSNLFIGTAYIPGILRHHSSRVRVSVEDGIANRTNAENLPRGYQTIGYNIVHHTQKYSLDYCFPLLYPDLSFGPIAYFKRIQATLFYDFMQYRASDNLNENKAKYIGNVYSLGTEIGVETHFLRFFVPFTPIIRYSYMPLDNQYRFSFSISSSYSF